MHHQSKELMIRNNDTYDPLANSLVVHACNCPSSVSPARSCLPPWLNTSRTEEAVDLAKDRYQRLMHNRCRTTRHPSSCTLRSSSTLLQNFLVNMPVIAPAVCHLRPGHDGLIPMLNWHATWQRTTTMTPMHNHIACLGILHHGSIPLKGLRLRSPCL